jgi:hypothetical protein
VGGESSEEKQVMEGKKEVRLKGDRASGGRRRLRRKTMIEGEGNLNHEPLCTISNTYHQVD